MRTLAELKAYLKKRSDIPPRYGIAVAAFIFTDDDKLILTERGEKARDEQGKLEGIGGGLKKGEGNLYRALKREIREELGDIDVRIDQFLGIVSPQSKKRWVVANYLCKLISGKPRVMEKDKMKSILYMPLVEINDVTLSSFQKIAMNIYREKFGILPYYKIL